MDTNSYGIPRDSLIRIMDNFFDKRFVYICAPAGYGKTFFIHQWLDQRNTEHILLMLDEYDNDFLEFCRHICSKLLMIQPNNNLLREIVSHASFESVPDAFVLQAIGCLSSDKQFNFVVDDLHIINNDKVTKLFTVILRRLPKTAQIVLLSREEPPDSFLEFILKGDMVRINAEQFIFSRNEIILFFRNNRQQLNSYQTDEIYNFTGGWPIALNALLISGVKPSGKKLEVNHLEAFLKSQVWDKWDKKIQDFMLKTSVIDELTPEFCIELSGEPNSLGILEELVSRNAFIMETERNTYHFHQLFRKFLSNQAKERGHKFLMIQLEKAGDWYLKHEDFYNAIVYFMRCSNQDKIAQCFNLLEVIDNNKFVIERIIHAVQDSLDNDIANKFPFLYFIMSWAKFSEGQAQEMMNYLDQYYSNYRKIISRNPGIAHNIFFLQCIDFRHTLHEMEQLTRGMQKKPEMKPIVGTVTQNLPFFHRSFRDFSEYSNESAADEIRQLKATIGGLLGEELDMLAECLTAGILYERGEIIESYKYILSANARIKKGFMPEAIFCTLIIYIQILDVLHQPTQVNEVLNYIYEMIKQQKAYYLNYNMTAFVTRQKMEDGDAEAATAWINENGTNPYDTLDFYRIFGHFTTARAYITIGNYENAIIILTKLLKLCKTYRRPLDTIEVQILLSITYWKKRKGFQREALSILEQAIVAAFPYGYVQIFINDGAELFNMLHRIKNRITDRTNYSSKLQLYVKDLYRGAMKQSQYKKGMTSGNIQDVTKYTERQKEVMNLVCNGNSYRQIAEILGVKMSTVRSHIDSIYNKLGVSNKTEAILKINETGILDEE